METALASLKPALGEKKFKKRIKKAGKLLTRGVKKDLYSKGSEIKTAPRLANKKSEASKSNNPKS